MADHFIAINKGADGFKRSDFTTATSTTAAADFELRIADAVVGLTQKDVDIALQAFQRFIHNKDFNGGFPLL